MLNFNLKFPNPESGQTLIETVVAIFIFSMGITAALGLSVYAFSTSTSITKQIVGTGLAREGIEAVKNMRDSNWLQDTLGTQANSNGCYDFSTSQAGKASCYKSWLGNSGGTVPFCLNPTSGNGPCVGDISSYNNVLRFDPAAANFWVKFRQTNSHGYGLTFNPATTSPLSGFYSDGINGDGTNGIACQDGASDASGMMISDYCRKIVITKISNQAPYNQDDGPLLEVRSQVWWVDKNCPRVSDWPGLGKCSVELVTHLTNWKNY